MECWSDAVMEGLTELIISTLAFSNTPVLRYSNNTDLMFSLHLWFRWAYFSGGMGFDPVRLLSCRFQNSLAGMGS